MPNFDFFSRPYLHLEKKKAMEYMGQVSTVWLLGGVLVLPALLVPAVAWVIGTIALGVMLWQSLRRFRLILEG